MIPFQTEEELESVERTLSVYGVNDLMSPPTVRTYIDKLKKPDFDRILLTAKNGIKFQQMAWHGCLSGDCPHQYQGQCDKALAEAYREAMADGAAPVTFAPGWRPCPTWTDRCNCEPIFACQKDRSGVLT